MLSGAEPVAVVTGASSGIGVELARLFAADGHRVALVARRRDRLEALAAELVAAGAKPPVIVALDLSARDASAQLMAALATAKVEPAFLVNNAGYGLAGPFADAPLADTLGIVDVNTRVLTELCIACAPALERHRGGILNVASVAGFLPGPGMAVYYASKAYVLSLSEALHGELAPRGVRVSVLCPGPVRTEFHRRAGLGEESRGSVLDVPAAAVARAGYRGLMKGRRLIVPGLGNKAVTLLVRLLPRGFVAWMSGAAMRARFSRVSR